jgi:hypothetical protein
MVGMARQKADPELLRQALALVAEGLSPSEASERLGRRISTSSKNDATRVTVSLPRNA